MSGPVSRGECSESLVQVVVLLEPLDNLLQLFLSSLDWSKPVTTSQVSSITTKHSGFQIPFILSSKKEDYKVNKRHGTYKTFPDAF